MLTPYQIEFLRNALLILGVIGFCWKLFKILNAFTETSNQVITFMATTKTDLTSVKALTEKAVGNHLEHIEEGITRMATAVPFLANSMDEMRKDLKQHEIEDAKFQVQILEELKKIN